MSKRRKRSGPSPSNRCVSPVDSKKKKRPNQSGGASGHTPSNASAPEDATAMNASDVGDFGGSVENLNAAGLNVTKVKVKLPPLVVKKVEVNKLIADFHSMGVAAEFKLCRIGIKVMLSTKADYDKAAAFLKQSKMEFFTHDVPGEKPFKAVIRGLPNYEPKRVETELKERYKLAPTAVYSIKRRDENTKKYPDSLFLVHFQKGTVTLNALKAIRSLSSVIVSWEPYRGGQRDVTQCQRCLDFGHGTRNCNVLPRCSFCAQNHSTSDCPMDGAVAFKCANCGGSHQGTDRQCSKREDYKRIRKQASSKNQPGRKTGKTPVFRSEDFPPLHRGNAATKSTTRPGSPGASARSDTPPPPGFWRQPAEQNNPDLFSADELMEIFVNMTGALRKCRSKPEQIQVLGKFIIQYGV